MQWTQIYDPLGHWWFPRWLRLPIIVLFTLLAGLRVKPHWCAIVALRRRALRSSFKMPPVLPG